MAKNKISKSEEMAVEKIPKLVLRYSSVTFLSLFFSALYNLVDTLFVSHGIGDNAMGGVSIVFPFMMIQAAVAQMVGAGAASIVSRALGAGDAKKAGQATLNAMLIFYSTAIFTTVLGFVFFEDILVLLGATEEIMPYAREYFAVMLVGTVFSTGFSSIIRAEGRMTYALMIWVVPTTVNIVLDWVFIFALHLGAKGAALATVACQFTSFCMSMIFFSKLSCQKFKGAKLDIRVIGEIIGVGTPTLILLSTTSVSSIVFNNILRSTAGTVGVNAFAYISKIMTFAVVPFNAMAQAIAPIIDFNHGRGEQKRVRSTLVFSSSLSIVYAVFAAAVLFFFSYSFIGVFTKTQLTADIAARGMSIAALSLPLMPISMIAATYYQSLGKKLSAVILNISALIIMLLCCILLGKAFSLDGVWASYPLGYVGAAFVTAVVVFVAKKSHASAQISN